MDAEIAHRMRAAVCGSPDHDRFAEQRGRDGLLSDVVPVRHRMPAARDLLGKRRVVPGHARTDILAPRTGSAGDPGNSMAVIRASALAALLATLGGCM